MKYKISKFINNIEEYVGVGLFSALIILCFLQILFRFVFNFSLSWTEELSRYVFISLVYISASLAVIRGAHVRVEVIDNYITGKAKKYLDTAIDLSFAFFMAYIGYYGIGITMETLDVGQTTPALGWSSGWVYSIIPFSFYLIAFRLIQRAYQRITGTLEETDIIVECD